MRPGTRGHAVRRLRLLIGTTLLVLSFPLALLLQRVYQQLDREVVYQHRVAAEDVVTHINQRLADILHTEEQRPFDEYSFLRVTANPLFKASAIAASPLSTLPPQSAVPGVLGYFQINPDGSLQSPVLPDLEENDLAVNVDRFGFGSSELARRLMLRHRLQELLLAGAPVTERPRRPKTVGQPAVPPATAASAAGSFQDALERAPTPVPSKAPRTESPAEVEGQSGPGLGEKRPTRKDTGVASGSATLSPPAPGATPAPKLTNPRTPAYRERRKEQVALPEQSTVSQVQEALDKLSSRTQETSPAVEMRRSLDLSKPANAAAGKKERAVKILTFESEVDPLQFTVLGTDHLVFFRKAWRNNLRYIQGFVVEKGPFLHAVIEAPLGTTALGQSAALTVHTQGRTLYTRLPGQQGYESGAQPRAVPETMWALYRAPLEAPLDVVEVLLSAGAMPRSAGAMVVDALALTLVLVLLGSHYGLYRLGRQQIALAMQRSDFVSAVSHELKTPLTAIRMYGEMLREGWVQDEQRRQSYYDFIFFESERLSRLIANVLQLARLTNQDAPLELRAYPLHQLLDVVRSKISTQAEAAGFELCFLVEDTDKALVSTSVLADEDAFVQICINLVDNALKFSANAAQKRIDVGLRPHIQPHQVVLFVRDYGPGVAHDQMQRIFQLFYRAGDELTRQTKGTGIGLALVQALAMKMHAQVNLRNHTPGAEFQLIMPTLAAH